MLKIIILLTATLLLSLQATPLLQTGQTKSYNADGDEVTNGSIKDDGYYQKGTTRNYSRDWAVVTDNVTGLEWQDNETVIRQWLEDDKYDACTNGDESACYDTSGITATTYCSDLSLDGGGWRLPTIEELETIVDDGKYNPSVTEGVFQHISSSYYWSSTAGAYGTSGAWGVNFYGGNSRSNGKSYNYYVRCVRGGQ